MNQTKIKTKVGDLVETDSVTDGSQIEFHSGGGGGIYSSDEEGSVQYFSQKDEKTPRSNRENPPATVPAAVMVDPMTKSHTHRHRQSTDGRHKNLSLKAGIDSAVHRHESRATDCQDKEDDPIVTMFMKNNKREHNRSPSNRNSVRSHQKQHSPTSRRASKLHHHESMQIERRTREDPELTPEPELPFNGKDVMETIAKLCSELNKKLEISNITSGKIERTHSNKSLQCSVEPKQIEAETTNYMKIKKASRDRNFQSCSHQLLDIEPCKVDNCSCQCDIPDLRAESKLDLRNKTREPSRYPIDVKPTRTYMGLDLKDRDSYRDTDKQKERRVCEHKSRSYLRESGYPEDVYRDRNRRSDKFYERDEDRYYQGRQNEYKDVYDRTRSRKYNYDTVSIASRDEHFRDRYSERERESGFDLNDGGSIVSGKSGYLKAVKLEIAEQREAMDKMMKLWKELMRCFKGSTNEKGSVNKKFKERAETVRDSATEQLKLWRECMRRYETVAKDVGDTDARLKEEINKQRSEMSEMTTMWQECLQRYRDISNDFNSLKQQVSTKAVPSELACGVAPSMMFRQPDGNMAPYQVPMNYHHNGPVACGYSRTASPLRARMSAPPDWWAESGDRDHREPSRRRSSPDSKGSRERERSKRRKRKEYDESRYKAKTKNSSGRDEYRHRKR